MLARFHILLHRHEIGQVVGELLNPGTPITGIEQLRFLMEKTLGNAAQTKIGLVAR
jgi:hypothetical protein